MRATLDLETAEDAVLQMLDEAPSGLPTIAIIDMLERRGIAPSVASELIQAMRNACRIGVRSGLVVACQ